MLCICVLGIPIWTPSTISCLLYLCVRGTDMDSFYDIMSPVCVLEVPIWTPSMILCLLYLCVRGTVMDSFYDIMSLVFVC